MLGEVYKIDLEDGTLSAVKTFLAALSHFVSPHTQRVGCQSISNLLGGGSCMQRVQTSAVSSA